MFERRIEMHQIEIFAGLEAAKQYVENADKSAARYRAFLSNLKAFNKQRRYLDVGAGTGTLAAIIAQNNPDIKITAIELSSDMVVIGEQYIRSLGLQDQIEFINCDAVDEAVIRESGPFDLIYSTYSLHHWESPRAVIDNLISNLDQDGIIYVFDLRRVWWLYWVPVRNGFFNSIRAAYVRREIQEILTGFPPACYEIRSEFPFMQSVIIRKL